ncbi:PAAR domain-containing protein [Massilia sp. CFBP9012]|uniref:PAAR domain-containing protein n=1 Tax=Massilia sp. CFBP9012 TaxID=3096531 RepID=UPI002A6B0FD7|nr:PAAR domain-containing protein [Massilia sp. CFBP9012]MDY0976384.1 PAAR domain-containing protein [Massilia sp. CFBP9012]
MPNVIRLGDATSHGGKVESVSATHFTVDEVPVARVGDACSCPVKGHEKCTIAEGDPSHVISGIAVAYDGHRTTCGASLIASIGNFSGQ